MDLHADFFRHDRRSLDSPWNCAHHNDGRLISSMIALHGSALADTSTTTKHVSRYFRCRQSLAPWAQIILFLSGRRPGSFLTFKDIRMGEKIRATTIERPRHYLLIVYSYVFSNSELERIFVLTFKRFSNSSKTVF